MSSEQLEFSSSPNTRVPPPGARTVESACARTPLADKAVRAPGRGPFYVAPGDWARRGLVDAAFVTRSVAAMRDLPDSERQLREAMAEALEGIRAIDRVYGTEPNAWATATRERLWLEHFTAEEILRGMASER